MVFTEEKINNNWVYKAESWHGSFIIKCVKKLDAGILDDSFMAIISAKKSEGGFEHNRLEKDVKICYTFNRNKKVWLDNNEE